MIDIQTTPNGFCQAIMGIGINVNMESADIKQINQPWHSLRKITGKYIDRNQLCAALINSLLDYVKRFSNKGLSNFMDEWKKKDCLVGQCIHIQSGSNKLSGVASGINAQGHLILIIPDKTIREFSSGDATLTIS